MDFQELELSQDLLEIITEDFKGIGHFKNYFKNEKTKIDRENNSKRLSGTPTKSIKNKAYKSRSQRED